MNSDDVVHTYLGATTMRSFLHAAIGALTDDNEMSLEDRAATACAEIEGAISLLDGCTKRHGKGAYTWLRLVPDPEPAA